MTFFTKLAIVFAICGSAYAQVPPSSSGSPHPGQQQGQQGYGGDFAQKKQNILQHIQSRMQVLQTMQSCVTSATDHKAIEQCHQAEKQAMDSLRSQGGH